MEVFVGTIKSFVDAKGYGFIECQDTFEQYGKDIFVMRTALPNGTASKGDAVTFSVQAPAGRPEAFNVQPHSQHSGGRGAPRAAAAAIGGQLKRQMVQNGDGSYTGVVKSFNPQKGWGMIECAETFSYYGKDMFVIKSSLPAGMQTIESGTPVRFSIIEGVKGPEAGHVQLQQQRRPRPAPSQRPVTQQIWPALAVQRAHFVAAQPPAVADDRLLSSHHAGEIKSFNEEKGWGFITPTSNKFGKDVFVMRTSLPPEGVRPGDKVDFKVEMGTKGLQATEVRVVANPMDLAGQIYEGVIKSYVESKGWGFIASDVAEQNFGRDIFFHKKDLGERVPEKGEPVEFSVTSNAQGHPQAVGLTFSGEFKAAPARPSGGKGRAKPY